MKSIYESARLVMERLGASGAAQANKNKPNLNKNKKILNNYILLNKSDETFKIITNSDYGNFKNYSVSNYGRIKNNNRIRWTSTF